MKIGRYDQKISFISEGTTADNYGGTTPTETIELETFASIKQMSQSKTIEQLQLGLPATYKVSVHYRLNFTPTVAMRVVWRGNYYNIITTPEVENVRIQREWVFIISKV